MNMKVWLGKRSFFVMFFSIKSMNLYQVKRTRVSYTVQILSVKLSLSLAKCPPIRLESNKKDNMEVQSIFFRTRFLFLQFLSRYKRRCNSVPWRWLLICWLPPPICPLSPAIRRPSWPALWTEKKERLLRIKLWISFILQKKMFADQQSINQLHD